MRVAPSFMISELVGEPAGYFFLLKSLKPVMIPFLESAGGSCQLAVMLVEVSAVTVKLVGACEGTEID